MFVESLLEGVSKQDREVSLSVVLNQKTPDGVQNGYLLGLNRVYFYSKRCLPSVSPSDLNVEAEPSFIVNAARSINSDNAYLAELSHRFVQPIKGPTYGEFIDLVIAGKLINREGQIKEVPDFEGEALILCALLGDQKAALDLIRRKQILDSVNQGAEPIKEVDLTKSTDSGFSLDRLIAVHVTNYLPYQDNFGNLYVRSCFDSGGEEEKNIARLTIHFALNHHVEGHTGGSWSKQRYVLLAPLEDMIELNGLPYSMRPEDTYFMTSPNDPFRLPRSTVLLRPNEDRDTNVIPINTVGYNFEDLSISDIEKIGREWNNIFWGKVHKKHNPYQYDIRTNLGSIHPVLYDSLSDYLEAQVEYVKSNIKRYEGKGPKRRVFRLHDLISSISRYLSTGLFGLRRLPLEDLVNDKIGTKLPQAEAKKMVQAVKERIVPDLSYINKRFVTEDAICALGYEVMNIEPYYIEDEEKAIDLNPGIGEVLNLAQRIGVSTERHPNSKAFNVENILWNTSRHGDLDLKWQKELKDGFLTFSPQVRRMLYLMGYC